MGMFDTLRSSYDLGPGFYNKNLQTKGLDCIMAEYWISPAGELFEIDYSGTQDWEPTNENKWGFTKFKNTPNGNHGKVRPVVITKTIEVYPEKWDAYYKGFPRIQLTFIDGILSK